MGLFNKNIKIDFSNDVVIDTIKLVQGEIKARTIHFALYDGSAAVVLTGCTVRVYIMPYGATIGLYEDCVVTNAQTGKVDYTPSGNTAIISGEGLIRLEILVTGSPDPLAAAYSRKIPLVVAAKENFTGAIIASTVFSALQSALATAGTYLSRIVTLETADGQNVKLTGEETITGLKSVPTPTAGAHIANKDYIDRQKTSGNLTYYVSTTGNDNNNGLTAGTPFRTIAQAISMIPQIVNHGVAIILAAGTYGEVVTLAGYVGSGTIAITGGSSLATAVNYKINNMAIKACGLTSITITGIKAVTTGGFGFYVQEASVNFSFCTEVEAGVAYGFYFYSGWGACSNCLTSNAIHALAATYSSNVYSADWTAGAGNTDGLYSVNGSTIGKSGTQPQGTESAARGGVIR